MSKSSFSRLFLFISCLALCWTPASASAHLATFGSWEITRSYLQELFPEATTFLKRADSYSDQQVTEIEEYLGFSLYPEDRNPEFYIAVQESGDQRRLLGVGLFIDPRVQARGLKHNIIRLEVGIGVDTHGKVKRVRVFEYKGSRELAQPKFLDQLIGKSLDDDFSVGQAKTIKPVVSEPEESQLVANAAREALYLMKISFGKRPQ